MLCKYAMAPVTDTAHSLHAATPMWRRSIRCFNFVAFFEMEALSETSTHAMPFLTMRVTCGSLMPDMATGNHPRTDDSFVWRDMHIMRKSKPIEPTADR